VSYKGATGTVAFDAKGDRKDAEMTIFKLQGGKVVPVAIVKGGQTTPFTMAACPGARRRPRPGRRAAEGRREAGRTEKRRAQKRREEEISTQEQQH
jgi:branched-chain amino acid transport system substrate-binding protein